MDGYAPAYVAHNVPFLVVSGLGGTPRNAAGSEDEGVRIASGVPPVESKDAELLITQFKESNAEGLAWNGRAGGGRNKFRVKIAGREYILPRRSARLPDSSPRLSDSNVSNQVNRPVLHSTLSPLTPGSSLFPDGLIDPRWIEKHQDLVPSAYISCYQFTSDPKLAMLHDNQLKTDITNIKRAFGQSGYKTRLVVVLLSESSILKFPGVEDRLTNIRKATGLDSKTSIFFLPPQSSLVEIRAFVDAIISTIYPICIEYYRDLSKHSRRKRNRGIIPPPTFPPTSGTSQTLSGQGWNVRYDFKLGVFAEFRQEMDVAVRSYESGYELLLGPDVLEAIANWNPRWNEARFLADVFAIRILRCLLWNGNSTAAVRRWYSHRERIRDFVDRRGKGSSTYGWEAWEARWATIMAEIVEKAAIPEFTMGTTSLYLHPEKTMPVGERHEPQEYLHHPGYWFYLASEHLVCRRIRALAIPEDDRSAPGSLPASQLANKAHNNYDTYLCPYPHEENPLPGGKGVDHSLLIIQSLEKAIAEFDKRKQSRLVHELSIQLANESMKRGDWFTAFHTLRPLWQKMSFRCEGWWDAVEEVGWALRDAAAHIGDGGTIIAVDWELLHRNFTQRQNWRYDLAKSLETLEQGTTKPVIVLHDQEVRSFLSATFVFEKAEGKIGELCHYQLAVTSQALSASAPVTMTEVRLEFDGSMKPLEMRHKETTEDKACDTSGFVLSRVSLTDAVSGKRDSHSGQNGRSSFVGEGNLTFWPGQTKVFWFSSLLREAGDAKALSATFSLNSKLFDLDYVQKFGGTTDPDIWLSENLIGKRLLRPKPSSITILPKPPKVELRFVSLQDQYYANESITLQLEITNGEAADSIISLDVRLLGDGAPPITFRTPATGDDEVKNNASPIGFSLGKIASAASTVVEIHIPPIELPAIYDLTMKASYHLVSDMETPVYHSAAIQLSIINPFEANYDFAPRVHADQWPSYFNHKDIVNADMTSEKITAHGLAQKWCLTSRYFSFATDDLIIEGLDIEVLSTNGAIVCTTKRASDIPEKGIRVSPKSLEEAEFDVFTQKISLDDRSTATLDVSLAIQWRRANVEPTLNTTILAVPRLLVSSSEPRVLAAVSYSATVPSMVHFDVIIENPSSHFLTFGLNMEPSDKFAFSGVKQTTLQLVPLSRRTMRFRLIPFIRGDWIGPVRCLIRDKYFQKVLKIVPTEGMKIDKDGILVWVPLEEE